MLPVIQESHILNSKNIIPKYSLCVLILIPFNVYIYDLNYFCSLAESNLPYKLLARSGVHDMLAVGGDKVIYVKLVHKKKNCICCIDTKVSLFLNKIVMR